MFKLISVFFLLNSPSIVMASSSLEENLKQPNMLSTFIPLVLVFVTFYFFVFRPQSRKVKDHKKMLDGLRKGDQIITSGGIIAKIVRIEEDLTGIVVNIAEGVNIKIKNSAVVSLVKDENTVVELESKKIKS